MKYYVNSNEQSNWDHEVHNENCSWLPDAENCVYLWDFTNCSDAVKEAKKKYTQSNWCYHCSYLCHTS